MSSYHRLDAPMLAALASGTGGTAAIKTLAEAQVSKHLLLIKYLFDAWSGDTEERDRVAAALARAQDREPDRVANVLGAPLVGAWAVIASRAQHRGMATAVDVQQLSALAAVIAAVTGVDAAFSVEVRSGQVALPTLGVAQLASMPTKARLTASEGTLTVRGGTSTVAVPTEPTRDALGWEGVRHLRVGVAEEALRLVLDDLSPYRHGHHAPPAERLAAEDVAVWQRRLVDAWQLLTDRLPERAAELRTGLRTLVPLSQPDCRVARSATIRHVFGAFGLTRPTSGADFAVTLVHEFQHSKLSAVLDIVPLYDNTDAQRYFAPWRADPRPLGGLFQGIYAFLGVADVWRALRDVPGVREPAVLNFATARIQVDRGLTALERSPALTASGALFVARMRASVDAMLAEPVPAAVARAAEDSFERTRQAWSARNSVPVRG